MPHQILHAGIVMEYYKKTINEKGIGSARLTAELMYQAGFKNQVTHGPLTKQAILECMRKCKPGRALLAATAANKWKKGRYASTSTDKG